MSIYRCAACGSPNVMLDAQSSGIKYNYVKGAVGDAILGPGGAIAGIENKETQVFKCADCGMSLTYCMPLELKTAIDDVVHSSERQLYTSVTVNGKSTLLSWQELRAQYRNIEDAYFEKHKELLRRIK